MKKQFLFSLLLVTIISMSCSEDDEKSNFIDLSLGDYSVVASDYQLVNEEWVEQPEFEDEFDFNIKKGNNTNTIEVFFGNDLLFEFSNINTTEIGYSFDLDDLEFDGENWIGYEARELGNTLQHGSYNHENKKLTFYIRRTGDTDAFLTKFVATKK